MGCFNTVNVPCPSCGAIEPMQSKAGSCNMDESDMFSAEAVDYIHVADSNEPVYCPCGTIFKPIYQLVRQVVVVGRTPYST